MYSYVYLLHRYLDIYSAYDITCYQMQIETGARNL